MEEPRIPLFGAYPIHLEASQDRYQKLKPLLDSLACPVHWVSGVDGFSLSKENIDHVLDTPSYRRFYNDKIPGPGTVGCYLGHCHAWESFLQSPYPYGLIFEDDVSFDPILFAHTLQQVLDHRALWDICSFALHGRRLGQPCSIRNLNGKARLCLYLQEVYCAGAYLITRNAAENLLKDAFPMQFQLDDYYSQTWRWNMVFVGVEPRVAFHCDEGVSDITNRGSRQFRPQPVSEMKRLWAGLRTWAWREGQRVRRFIYNFRKWIALRYF